MLLQLSMEQNLPYKRLPKASLVAKKTEEITYTEMKGILLKK